MAALPPFPPPLISKSVGIGGANAVVDVQKIAYLMNIIAQGPMPPLDEGGTSKPPLTDRIKFVQLTLVGMQSPDGNVGPKGATLRAVGRQAALQVMAKKAAGTIPPALSPFAPVAPQPLSKAPSSTSIMAPSVPTPPPAPAQSGHRVATDAWITAIQARLLANERDLKGAMAPGAGQNQDLDIAEFEKAAKAIGTGVEAALVQAFAKVESGPLGAFGSAGKPVIAYEGHIFRRETDGAYDANWPTLSHKYVKKAGPEWQANNKTQDTAWKTLATAASLDVNAALTASSWGRFQIMGFNSKPCGYADVIAFVEGMKAGEAEQLAAFVAFCRSLKGFTKAMVDKDYKTMASSYNGADYGDYDKRIENAYTALTKT